jgi:hypothetical protein
MTRAERDDEMRDVAREVLRELAPGMLREVMAAASNGHANGDAQANGHHHGETNGDGHANGEGAPASNGQQGGDGRAPAQRQPDAYATVVPQVPAPPVAAVLRPSTWDRPPAPGEIIGNSPAAPASDASPRRARLRTAFEESEFKPSAQPPAPAPSQVPSSGSLPARDVRVELVAIETNQDLNQFIRQLMSRLENPRERLAIRTGQLRFELRRSPAAASAGGSTAPATRVEKGAVTERMIRTAAAEGTRLVLAPGAVLTPLARELARARGVEIEKERRC